MMFLRFLPWAGWPLAAVAFLLWLGARDEIVEEREACNTEVVRSALDAEIIAHRATQKNHDILLAELADQKVRELKAIEAARRTELSARVEVEGLDQRIDELLFEASIDEIPDSGECLSVFVLNDSIAGMRLQPEVCNAFGAGAWSAGGANCFRAEGINGTDSAGRDFANVTYGDTLKLWARDRATINTLNGRMRVIEGLGENDE